MKRSNAPSALFEKRQKSKLDDDDGGAFLTADQVYANNSPLAAASAKKGPGRKKVQAPIAMINHLDLFTPQKKKDDEEEKKHQELQIEEENKKGRNIVLRSDSKPIYYLMTYRNIKTSEDGGMGILEVTYNDVTVISMEGKQIGHAALTRMSPTDDGDDGSTGKTQKVLIKKKEVFFQEEFSLAIGNKWVKILTSVDEEDYKNGSIFLKPDLIIQRKRDEAREKKETYRLPGTWRPKAGGWSVPLAGGAERAKRLVKPLHNPHSPNALVLYQPRDMLSENNIPVVVDPILSAKLRPHQRQGVQFMFDCLLGFRGGYKGNGCILADDMGLGKSIQAIAILWTLLKQGPNGLPTAERAVIVAPSSLVGNWCKELKKWLGEGIKPVAIGGSTKYGRARLAELELGTKDVLVISYDQLRIYCEEIIKISSIGLVICDEGHRLKNPEIKTTKAVSMIPTPRRVILSGTPIQNDLNEFFAMVNFVNPGVLKNMSTFQNVYDAPILASRNPDASDEDKRLGRERSAELTRLTQQFILRRTAAVNVQYLPKKIEYTVFIKLSPLQHKIYKHLVDTIKNQQFGNFSGALPLITTLKKLTNCPELIYLPDKEDPTQVNDSVLKLFPKEWNPKVFQPQYSGKLQFVDKLLAGIRKTSKDRVVIISNYTQTLTVLAGMMRTRGYEFFQLDGSTSVDNRQKMVDLFNDPSRNEFVFLLSSKAGGVGLNLIGANHLVLYDPDWNPANDLQAMARVWREGQKKVVSIYRTLSTGTIEEKIFQRQITKMALSTSVVEGDSDNAPAFETKDLKDIFNLREDTICDTHDMLGTCKCGAPTTRIPKHKRDSMSIGELASYDHYYDMSKLKDKNLQEASRDIVSFMFANDKPPTVKEKKKPESSTDYEQVDVSPSSQTKKMDNEDDANFIDDDKDYEEDSDTYSSGSEAEEASDSDSD
ncbi:SNF2-related domain-containing protein [Cavenderia fasciculata]|uniref:SNF2-related domain-containing protein n=1 Tax=Cavenderia fasciculata TaxID=261658 RepID=F4PLC3_CACFS|nr:SNF2-related domain-containing protein [Cavenderia fasciculata]EGG23345.1 SNF2-related domain-containing protein [Cavenderia fasciculata]|eukprot:XP_004361196.1 SNF2-related domain-containing protein [Cavenderia fasciculata]